MIKDKDLFNRILIGGFILSCITVFIGCSWNHNDFKYSRSKGTPCNRGILVLTEENSHICCDLPHYSNTWVCTSSFDRINPLFSSYWALLIPLLPWLINSILDLSKGYQNSIKRLIVYCSIFFIRTVLLYKIPSIIQDWLQYVPGAVGNCWCNDFVSEMKCQLHFDFSDHIVLNMVQYVLPCSLELHYTLSMMTRKPVFDGIQSRWSMLCGDVRIVSVLAAVVLIALALRSMLLTCMFFHTRTENTVGFMIASVLLTLPLYCTRLRSMWVNTVLE